MRLKVAYLAVREGIILNEGSQGTNFNAKALSFNTQNFLKI